MDKRATEAARQAYHKHLGSLASEAMFDLVRRGDLPGCPPVGYRNSPKRWGPRIVADEELAPLVREAFRLGLDPELSIRQILARVTAMGLVSRSGRKLGPPALLGILTNPFYTGRIRYYGELVPGNHPVLVDDATFAEVLEARRGRKRKRRKRAAP